MKNCIIMLLLVMCLMLTACGAAPAETEMEPAEAGNQVMLLAEDDWEPQIFFPGEGGGAGYNDLLSKRYSVEQLAFAEDPTAISGLPAFVNPYADSKYYGWAYEVTEEMRQTMRQRVADFLDRLYGDYSPEKYPFWEDQHPSHADPYHSEYDGDDIGIISRIDSLGVSVGEKYGQEIIALLQSDGDLRQSPPLAIALDIVGIDDWETGCLAEYDSNGEVRYYEYLVYQRAEDSAREALNRAFTNIKIICFPNRSSVGIRLPFIDYENYETASTAQKSTLPLSRALVAVERELPELAQVLEPMKQEAAALEQAAKITDEKDAVDEQEQQAAEFEDATDEQASETVEGDAALAEQNPQAIEGEADAVKQLNLKARAVYRYDVKEGYIIPCWELYIPMDETAADGTALYSAVYVPMVDTAALADRL